MSPLILGLDPGSRLFGVGLLEAPMGRYHLSGVIPLPPSDRLSQKLVLLESELQSLVSKHSPALVVLERAFVHRDVHAALVLGHVRGVCLLVMERLGLEVLEVAPAAVKKTIAGKGNASKEDVQTAVCRLLRLSAPPSSDASDALALALYGMYASKGNPHPQG